MKITRKIFKLYIAGISVKLKYMFLSKACHTLCIMVMYLQINFRVIPKNIHAQPKDSHWKFQG